MPLAAPKKRTRSASPAAPATPVKARPSSPAAAAAIAAARAHGAASPKKYGAGKPAVPASPKKSPSTVVSATAAKGKTAPAAGVTGAVDPDLPMSPDGVIYHLACKAGDLADKIILVGDPGRVSVVAGYFDEGSITFNGSHREINIATGSYRGTRVSCVSTGMGTDNVEIIINEIHALKEYNVKTNQWTSDKARKPEAVHLIRVGTCGSPRDDVAVGTLAISNHAIGMDNTCRYYDAPAVNNCPSVKALEKAANSTGLGKIHVYAAKAHPDIVKALVSSIEALNKKKKATELQPFVVGTTASGSGFYGCQGRAVGQFRGHLTVPNLVDELGSIAFPVPDEGSKKKGATTTERVVNIEMENSAVCYLSSFLGYKAGTVCAIIARRAGNLREFATPEVAKRALANAITAALDAVVAVPSS